MCFEYKYLLFVVLVMSASCNSFKRVESMRSGVLTMDISVSDEKLPQVQDAEHEQIESRHITLDDGTILMNAVLDEETGEMVANDVISASKVVARFRNVAERNGHVTIRFDLTVPSGMADSKWQLKICPCMIMKTDTIALDPVYITGKDYRDYQLRGYERYRRFLSSIITDSSDLIYMHQLEVFLRRHFPETYAMKSDSTFISEPEAESAFGVTQKEALIHYTRTLKSLMNERRKQKTARKYEKFIKDPIVSEALRLDTVLTDFNGDFIYCYEHTFRSTPGLKKVDVFMDGSLYEKGECILTLPLTEEITFYISSLSTLVDDSERYRIKIIERMVYDKIRAQISFAQGSAVVDTSLADNAKELALIHDCIEKIAGSTELALDSLVVTAACSPEGSFLSNRNLSRDRSESIASYIGDWLPATWRDHLRTERIPEDWDKLLLAVECDTLMSHADRAAVMKVICSSTHPDQKERQLSRMPVYNYLRNNLYPGLRAVEFDFHLHRIGMQRDTIHTLEIDSLYMEGVRAMKNLDYKHAMTLLRSYRDYNSALAYMSADCNHSAWDILKDLDDSDAKVCYLKALVLMRMGKREDALEYFRKSVELDYSMSHRANLDPEMHDLVNDINQTLNTK